MSNTELYYRFPDQSDLLIILLDSLSVPLFYFAPIYDIEESCEIVRATVLIVQVVCMFPNVYAQYWSTFDISYIHEWIVLIRCRAYDELFVSTYDQPCPARAETGSASLSEVFFEFVKATEL
jgi:hypothetical protein